MCALSHPNQHHSQQQLFSNQKAPISISNYHSNLQQSPYSLLFQAPIPYQLITALIAAMHLKFCLAVFIGMLALALAARSPTPPSGLTTLVCERPASLAACKKDCRCDGSHQQPDCGHPDCYSNCRCRGKHSNRFSCPLYLRIKSPLNMNPQRLLPRHRTRRHRRLHHRTKLMLRLRAAAALVR